MTKRIISSTFFFNEKTYFTKKKFSIRETKNPLTDADNSTDTTGEWTKNTQIPKFLKNGKKSYKTKKQIKNVQKYAKISNTPFDKRSLIHQEAWFPLCFVRQNQPKKTIFLVWQFQTTSKQKCSNLRPLLSISFPQGF